jgi:signal transduction histidine kinase
MPDSLDPLPSADTKLLHATGSPEGNIYFRDDAWKHVFGATKNPWAHLDSGDQKEACSCLREAAEGALVTEQLFMVDHPDEDEPLPTLLNFLPVRAPARDRQSAAIEAITITGEVLAEPTSWTKNQTQRHRFETLGRMTMGIAHDFNNLLSGILGYTELLTSGLENDEDPPVLDNLRIIEKAALDGAGLIAKIQEYIRQEKQTRFEPVDLTELVEDCISLTRPYWYNEPRRQGIDIEMETDLNDVPPVMGSATELREVFVNLVLNATQALPDGGCIRFQTKNDPDKGVILTVSDDGTGMDAETREQIFDPMFTTKGEDGTGMGLSVSYGIVQEHDGTIDVESAPGEGTTFTLVFPPADKTAPANIREAEEHSSREARILVVDDEPMVRSVLTKLLTLNGHTVESVASGSEAISAFQNQPCDIVFTDHGMPEMSGSQLAGQLRQTRNDLPIVLLTGDTEIKGDGGNINAVVDKPFQIDELEALIQKLI